MTLGSMGWCPCRRGAGWAGRHTQHRNLVCDFLDSRVSLPILLGGQKGSEAPVTQLHASKLRRGNGEVSTKVDHGVSLRGQKHSLLVLGQIVSACHSVCIGCLITHIVSSLFNHRQACLIKPVCVCAGRANRCCMRYEPGL